MNEKGWVKWENDLCTTCGHCRMNHDLSLSNLPFCPGCRKPNPDYWHPEKLPNNIEEKDSYWSVKEGYNGYI
jgi:hypothetical protein